MEQSTLLSEKKPKSQDDVARHGRRIPSSDPVHCQLADFLVDEAYLLDEERFEAWLETLSKDILYSMPIRQTFARREKSVRPGSTSYWFYDRFDILQFKVRRPLDTDTAFVEDPPSRVRRLVSNVRVFETETPDAYFVQSCVLVRRNRGDAHLSDELSVRRDDIITFTSEGLRLSRRTIQLDQAVLGMSNLAIFL